MLLYSAAATAYVQSVTFHTEPTHTKGADIVKVVYRVQQIQGTEVSTDDEGQTRRMIVPDAKCARCGAERKQGGAFRYGKVYRNRTHIFWQERTFCSIKCMRAYWRDRELLASIRAYNDSGGHSTVDHTQ